MARFFDTLNKRELARVEHILKGKGIEYRILKAGSESPVNEILVAEEDLVYADLLLSRAEGSRH
jgi:hypothetical protein